MKYYLSVLLSLVLILKVNSQEYSTVQAPENYQPTSVLNVKKSLALKSAVAVVEQSDILLVQTSLPWDSEANTIVLNQLGYKYDIADISNVSTIDLFSYPVILIVNDQTQSFYDLYETQKSYFEDYVNGGGSLLFFAASDGWARGTLNANLPGEVEVVTPHYENYNYIVSAQHPIVTGELSDNVSLFDADLYNTYCSHGYFTNLPENATVILEESNGYPTLIEYRLGEGKVVASTQTWEHAYTVAQRAFALKALDDVFLYMFSEGYNPVSNDLDVELRIEDANSGILVNKIEDTYVDIIAKVTNNSEENAEDITISLSPDNVSFYSNLSIYKRTNKSDQNYTELTSSLSELVIGDLESGEQFEVVYRFKIKEDVIPDESISIDIMDISFDALLTMDESTVSSNTETFRLWERVGQMIVTNRTLLYEKYNANEVNNLLAKVYELSEYGSNEPSIIFYVDRYSNAAKNWNQEVDYTKGIDEINEVALEIDALIEKWYNQQKYDLLPLPVGVAPGYLAIIGADEIIPFYRVDNSDYDSDIEELYEDIFLQLNPDRSSVPVFDAYLSNFFLSDNIFGDTESSFSDAEQGKLELAVGRIVGHTAESMQFFFENSNNGPQLLNSSIVVSLGPEGAMQTDDIESAFSDNGYTILGSSNPDLIGNDNYTKSEFTSTLSKDFQIMAYAAHGRHNSFMLHNNIKNISDIVETDELNQKDFSSIYKNNPFIYSTGCHTGVVTNQNSDSNIPEEDDCLAYKLAVIGVSGYIAPTGFGGYQKIWNVKDQDELIINDFFENLFGANQQSISVGVNLKNTKKRCNTNLWDILVGSPGLVKKAVLQNTLYGLPWTSIESQSAQQVMFKSAKLIADDYSITDSIDFSIDTFAINEFFEYEILEISDCKQTSIANIPLVPYFEEKILLPKNTVIKDLHLIESDSINLGQHNLPQPSSTRLDDSVTYNDDYQFDVFPQKRIAYELKEFDDYCELTIIYLPIKFNATTREVTLFKNSKIKCDYEFKSNVIVKDFQVVNNTYGVGDSVSFNVDVININDSIEKLTMNIIINDSTNADTKIDLASNSKSNVNLLWPNIKESGYTEAFLTVKNDKDSIIGVSVSKFRVLEGSIENFNFPDTVYRSGVSNSTLDFKNYSEQSISALSGVKIYSESEKQVLNLIQQEQEISENSKFQFSWNFKTTDLEPGNYVAKSYVDVEDYSYGPVTKSFYIDKSIRFKSLKPNKSEIHMCAIPDLNLEVELSHGNNPMYQWYFNDTVLENFNDSVLHIEGFTFENEGNYYCKIFNEIDTVYSDTVSVLKKYIYQTSQAVSICEGESYFVQNAEQTVSGSYYDTLQTVNGCDSIIITNLSVNPSYETSIDISICEGESYFVQSAEQTVSGSYYDTLQTVSSCDSIIITNLSINARNYVNIGNDTTVFQNDTLIIKADGEYAEYLWNTGDTDDNIMLTNNSIGNFEYYVIVTDINECSNSDTITISVVISSSTTNLFENRKISVYPNPANNLLYIQADGDINSRLRVSIFNELGMLLHTIELENLLENENHKIDISNLNSGVYLLRLNNSESIKIHKIIKE